MDLRLAHSVDQVDENLSFADTGEAVLMHAGMGRGGKGHVHSPFRKIHRVKAGQSQLIVVRERKRGNHVLSVHLLDLAYGGGEEEVAQVGAAGTAQMRVREAQDGVVAIVVAAAGIPVFRTGVRAQLDQAVGRGGSGEGMPVETRADERIHFHHTRRNACHHGHGQQAAA